MVRAAPSSNTISIVRLTFLLRLSCSRRKLLPQSKSTHAVE
ncbi:hypothetical protein EV281_108198 [Rhizobium sp. BK418]|nr:hypothetical protein EV281_108198 [Rhizobium sp. BK418]